MAEPEAIGEILSRKSVGTPRKKRQALELIKARWPALVGEEVARESAPTKLSRGTLTVSARSGAWAAEISMQVSALATAVERMLGPGVVRKVKVRAASAETYRSRAGKQAQDAPRERGGVNPSEVGGEAGESLMGMEDAELRDALARLVVASRAGRQSRQKPE